MTQGDWLPRGQDRVGRSTGNGVALEALGKGVRDTVPRELVDVVPEGKRRENVVELGGPNNARACGNEGLEVMRLSREAVRLGMRRASQ